MPSQGRGIGFLQHISNYASGVLQLGEQGKQHWRRALPLPPRTPCDIPHLMSGVPPEYGPDGLPLQSRIHAVVSSSGWHLISEMLLRWQEVRQEPQS